MFRRNHDPRQAGRGRVPRAEADRRHRLSRSAKDHGANVVYKRLRDRGYTVFAVNPNADEVEGDRCYHDLKSVPDGVEGVVIGTSPHNAEVTMSEAVDLGINRVWMHRENGVIVIDGGCPLMFDPTADGGHKFMRMVGVGHMPKKV